MVDTIYIEQQVETLQRTEEILARYPRANQIVVEKYSEVFNPHAQNFRAQKQNPSLILAKKNNKLVLPTPAQYETGGAANYYFSHMLNCVYDCRYCFLQGMYRSANYLVFVNYEDFISEIKRIAFQHVNDQKPVWFFSGYDCDSLAYEPVTQFANYFLDEFQKIDNAVLELRTKSTQIRSLLERKAMENVVVAYSLSPQEVAETIELGAPNANKRLSALKKLQQHGWRIGLRFDPIIWHQDYQNHYQRFIQDVFTNLDIEKIDSVTLGGFRLPKGFYKSMQNMYPEHWLLSAGLTEHDGMVTYRQEIEEEALSTISKQILEHCPQEQLYTYPSY